MSVPKLVPEITAAILHFRIGRSEFMGSNLFMGSNHFSEQPVLRPSAEAINLNHVSMCDFGHLQCH